MVSSVAYREGDQTKKWYLDNVTNTRLLEMHQPANSSVYIPDILLLNQATNGYISYQYDLLLQWLSNKLILTRMTHFFYLRTYR